jgi:hypothetical protein
VELDLEGGGVVAIPVSNSVWLSCVDLRSSQIGRWKPRSIAVDLVR